MLEIFLINPVWYIHIEATLASYSAVPSPKTSFYEKVRDKGKRKDSFIINPTVLVTSEELYFNSTPYL